MTIDQRDPVRQHQGIHRQGVRCRDAYRDKPLPRATGTGTARAERLEDGGRHGKDGLHSGRADERFKERHGVRDDGDGEGVFACRRSFSVIARGQKVVSGQTLGGEDPVHCIERKLTPAVEEVGEMGLAKACLARQERHAHRSPFDPAQQFLAQTLMHLSKIHLWKIRHQQRVPLRSHFFWQCDPG